MSLVCGHVCTSQCRVYAFQFRRKDPHSAFSFGAKYIPNTWDGIVIISFRSPSVPTLVNHMPLSLSTLSLSLSLSLSLRQLGTRHIIEEMNTNRHTVQVIFICGGLRHNKTYVQATSDATGLCNIAAGNAAFEVGGLFFCALCYLLTPTALCREPYKSALGQKSSDLFSFTETISIVCTLKYGQFWFLVGHVFEKGSAPNVPRQLGWDLVGATIALTPKPCLAVDGVCDL